MQSLQPGQALQLHLQQVVSAELALQMLDGADTPGGERRVSRQGKRGETHRWGHGVLGPGQPASPAPRRDHRVGEIPSLRARPGTHPPQAPGHHDGHAVAHGLRLGHGVGGQQGAPRRAFNNGLDCLPRDRVRDCLHFEGYLGKLMNGNDQGSLNRECLDYVARKKKIFGEKEEKLSCVR